MSEKSYEWQKIVSACLPNAFCAQFFCIRLLCFDIIFFCHKNIRLNTFRPMCVIIWFLILKEIYSQNVFFNSLNLYTFFFEKKVKNKPEGKANTKWIMIRVIENDFESSWKFCSSKEKKMYKVFWRYHHWLCIARVYTTAWTNSGLFRHIL